MSVALPPAPRTADPVLAAVRTALLDARDPGGTWTGFLSSSALSTATAVAALAQVARVRPLLAARLDPLVARGCDWLDANANPDHGFGDTVDSPSNPSTTTLAWMGLTAAGRGDTHAARGARAWLTAELGGTDAATLAAGLARIYGDDRTFAVPILVACAAAGCFGAPGSEEAAAAWRTIPRLPFELAAFPRGLFRFLGLPVVSYALPALIAIGQAQHAQAPTWNPLTRAARSAARKRTLDVLHAIQPSGGGYLEATPLTSFVLSSLVAAGEESSPVVDAGLEFLARSIRSDGSWPIDTDLATWGTTLSINALGAAGLRAATSLEERARLQEHLLGLQFHEPHAYTGAAPGGWAWTGLSGGVPDADDTAGALLALATLRDASEGASGDDAAARERAAAQGLRWLLDLTNRDGGTPTFCRGWGKLPFDRSAPDLTAHALRAYAAWASETARAEPRLARELDAAASRGRAHLVRTQRADGAWIPLWFGSQHEPRMENPLYGTARVLCAAGTGEEDRPWRDALQRGLAWLRAAQGVDGGFGAAADLPPSIEETAQALEALAAAASAGLAPRDELAAPMDAAVAWLARATEGGRRFAASPIGLYFARLWYSDRHYPLVFTAAALQRRAELDAVRSNAP